ncbi:hypothetical protein Sste5346_002382 [Sporothrix stenoceras]|uniref:Phosphatidate phosphatase APP1 catalytic domain-containing protein n=1 Tax=Sporothrix stenoceras TaxID=5173 RepID=A0ABR3ZKA9_9PEZI
MCRGARAVRAPVPWKHPHALTRRRPPTQSTVPTVPSTTGNSSILGHLLRSKASFLDGYRAARSKAALGPPPRIPLRERYVRFRLETLPRYRQRAHSRLYRFLVDRAARRRGRLSQKERDKELRRQDQQLTLRLLPLAMQNNSYNSDSGAEHGSRRRRFAALANNVYRAGVAAASEIRDQYNTSRAMRDGEGSASSDFEEDRPPNIPGAFPDVAFATGGDAQMVLFPMYAKRHVRKYGPKHREAAQRYERERYGYDRDTRDDDSDSSNSNNRMNVGRHPDAAPNWSQEFARLEDEKAVVDVNVHGWLYLANRGPLTRKNRLLIGLARRLSGIPAPNQWAPVAGGPDASVATASPASGIAPGEDLREAQKIMRAAEAIERRGQGEKEVANRGQYSETPETAASYDDDSSSDDAASRQRPPKSYPPPPGPGKLTPKSSWSTTGTGAAGLEMTEAELMAANTNLLARLGPFLTTPVVDQPVTLFFYNETQSQSRTVTTSDAGHFSTCAALEFVPTHVRVLVSSSNGISTSSGADRVPANVSETALVNSLTDPLSAVAPIDLVEDRGVSLISDIDDTIKASNIALGTREIFRNTFVKALDEMAVEGAREWYTTLHQLGVQFHYCSNSPWQLFPMLTTFFKLAGLPRGPLHLKQYSGMLQGIFEPVAERKRGTLEKILRDFPHRRFLLVGDSGEADLEVYTDLVLAHPGRVLAIFIRDVTTPEQPGYFDATRTPVERTGGANAARRPALPPRMATAPPKPEPEGPVMGTLIDFDDIADSGSSSSATNVGAGGGLPSTIPPLSTSTIPPLSTSSSSTSVNTTGGGGTGRKPLPPPRPSKPLALRSSMAASSTSVSSQTPSPTTSAPSSRLAPPPPPPRKPVGSATSTANNSGRSSPRVASDADDVPPPPLPRRMQTGDLRSDRTEPHYDRPDRPAQQQQALPPNKKVDMWRRRLAHAQDVLGPQGVALYTWRRGQDVAVEAIGIVKQAMKEHGL